MAHGSSNEGDLVIVLSQPDLHLLWSIYL